MAQFQDPQHGGWRRKFACAARGLVWAVRSERTFAVHLPAAALVVCAAIALRASRWEWCLLVLCMSTVLAAELFNTAIEQLAHTITSEHDDRVRDALDTSSGAVLTSAIGAGVVGCLVLGFRLGCALDWWSD